MAHRPRGGLYALVQPSPALAAIVGARPLPRFEVTRRIWRYIKKHRLQDPHNGRIIRPDGALKRALGGLRRVDMMDMTRLLSGQVKAHVPARRGAAARRDPPAGRGHARGPAIQLRRHGRGWIVVYDLRAVSAFSSAIAQNVAHTFGSRPHATIVWSPQHDGHLVISTEGAERVRLAPKQFPSERSAREKALATARTVFRLRGNLAPHVVVYR